MKLKQYIEALQEIADNHGNELEVVSVSLHSIQEVGFEPTPGMFSKTGMFIGIDELDPTDHDEYVNAVCIN